MGSPTDAAANEARLRALFEQHATRVLAYAHRHVGPGGAQDVVSEVFLVAWRRLGDVPADALPWLLVVARNTIQNRRRSLARRQRLTDELIALQRSSAVAEDAGDIAVERRAMLAALADLPNAEREALLLTGWDGLSVTQAAQVAGCTRRALELRLHRARTRLRTRLADDVSPAGRPALRLDVTKETTS